MSENLPVHVHVFDSVCVCVYVFDSVCVCVCVHRSMDNRSDDLQSAIDKILSDVRGELWLDSPTAFQFSYD